jgi:uncharacterized membrane protein SpoIIM required for sporulation
MIGRFESKTLWQTDRYYILYQFVFTAMLMGIVCRSFFAELVVDRLAVITLIAAGIVTLCTPPIVDNDNDEF